jgi:hypothetical protein
MTRAIVDKKLVSTMEILREGQSALPANRQRRLSYATVHNCKNMIAEARNRASEQLRNRKLTELALKPVAPAPVAPPAPAPEVNAEQRLARMLDEILDILAEKVAARLQQPGVSISTRAMPLPEPNLTFTRAKHNPEPPSAPRVPKTGVLVIGLLNDQINALPQFNTLDLTFLQTEEALSRPNCRRAHTVLMTKFINHAVQDKYRKADNLRYCNGGTSELAKLLISIAIAEEQK